MRPNMLEVLNAARRAKLRVFYAMHHRYRPGDYETWKYIAPIQKRAWQGRACAASRRATSASASGQCRSISRSVLSDPRCHRVLSPASAGSHPQIHESLGPRPLQASALSTGQCTALLSVSSRHCAFELVSGPTTELQSGLLLAKSPDAIRVENVEWFRAPEFKIVDQR